MYQKMEILFGFDDQHFSSFSKGVVGYLRESGVEVTAQARTSKTTIRDYLRNNPFCYTVVLTEALNEKSKYTAEELAELTDDRDLNIIVVLSATHKGTPYMHTLYSAGITSAIFQDGKRGLSPKNACQYILRKRSRREAREYYGISDRKFDLGFLGNDTFVEYYNALSDDSYGENLIERFISVCGRLSHKQVADFIRRLDKNTRDELVMFEEFHVILQLLKKVGIDLKIKRPKKGVSVGLKDGDRILLEARDNMENKVKKTPIIPVQSAEMQEGTAVEFDAHVSELEVGTDSLTGLLGNGKSEDAGAGSELLEQIHDMKEDASDEMKILDFDELIAGMGVSLDAMQKDETSFEQDISPMTEDITVATMESEAHISKAVPKDDSIAITADMTKAERKAALKEIAKRERETKKALKLEKKIEKTAQKSQKKEKKEKSKEKEVVASSVLETEPVEKKQKKPVDKVLVVLTLMAVTLFGCLVFMGLVVGGIVPFPV